MLVYLVFRGVQYKDRNFFISHYLDLHYTYIYIAGESSLHIFCSPFMVQSVPITARVDYCQNGEGAQFTIAGQGVSNSVR